jgi:predicted amidophosphoribosyltransferase
VETNIKPIAGAFDSGYALDKHSVYSVPIGENEYGHMQFDTKRTEVGEAVYQLKYKQQHDRALALAEAVRDEIVPKFPKISLIIPMPASNPRQVQPVNLVAQELGRLLNVPVFEDILRKAPGGASLKNLTSREDKETALAGTITLNRQITSDGCWNALLLDDLFHTGASVDAASAVLRTYEKIRGIYVAALTWR